MKARSLTFLFMSLTTNCLGQASYIPLGDLPGGEYGSVGLALSGSGNVATGFSSDQNGLSGTNAFRWTHDAGMVSLAQPTGTTMGQGLSSNGSYTVGSIEAVPGVSGVRGAFWASSGEFHMIGDLPGSAEYSVLADVSDNGIAVGASAYADGPFGPINQAIRWTEQGGLEPLGFLPGDDISFAVDISADGSVIGGRGNTANWFWTESGGMVEAAPAGFEMRSMTSDGLFMLGRQNTVVNGNTELHAVLWSEDTGTVELDRSNFGPGAIISNAIDATPDAETIVGRVQGVTIEGGPYIWFDQGERGMWLEDYLLDNGLDFAATGYYMFDVFAMSDDGNSFLVQTFNPDGRQEAVLIVVPASQTAAVFGLAGISLCRRRRSPEPV